jgi:proline iminopeptidase
MYLKVNGTHLFFDVVGSHLQPSQEGMISRPIVLVLHGGPGVIDHTYFRPFLDPLGAYAQVIYLDLRGQGRSERHHPDYYQVGIMADDVAAFAGKLRIEHPVVLGHSFGGFVALSLAVRHPRLPGGLILLATSARQDIPWDLDCLERLAGKEAREVAARVSVGEGTEEDEQRFETELVPHFWYPPKPDIRSLLDRNPFVNEEISAHMHKRFAKAYDVRSELSTLSVRTLILHGRHDWVIPLSESKEMATMIPGAQLHIFEQAGHSVPHDTPEELIEQIRLFLT